MLKHAHQVARQTAQADYSGPPERQLRVFLGRFLGYLLDPKRPEWHGRLIAREMAEPTEALDRLVEESILPVKKRILSIVREFLGPDATETEVQRSCFSILGQCLYYVHCREMIARLFPPRGHAQKDIEALADHIHRFSVAGLTAIRHGAASKHPSTPSSGRKKS
ncbi:MAG: DUF1956 domain-containing protein [Methylacidiphilales bacterium]|nr:DUF1956 domain-containing protein [Candidatus Methylacidiphilales bacterium]